MSVVEVILPLPPSANRMWRMMRGRMTKSSEYRAWAAAAAESIAHQIAGMPPLKWFTLAITLPPTRRDPDNSIKALNDALQAGGAIVDDRYLRCLVLTVDDDRADTATALLQLREVVGPVKPAKKRKAA